MDSTGRQGAPGRQEQAAARRGIAWMLLTMLLFVSMDAIAKQLTQSFPVAQVVWARYFLHFTLLALFLNRRLAETLRTARLKLQLGRSLLLVVTTGLFFAGISVIPLADASAIMLVAPLLVTALSVPLLGERVGPRRWASVIVGFVGALVIIRPGAEVFELASLLPLGAAGCYAVYQITTRLISRTDAPLTTLTYTALTGAVITTAIVPFVWVAPAAGDWALMLLVGLLGAVSQFCLIKAYQAAPASVVVPFSYSNIVWATLYGYLLFADLPDLYTVIGAGVLIASGLYIFHREQVRRRR